MTSSVNSPAPWRAVPITSPRPKSGNAFLHLIAEEIGTNAALEATDLDHGTLKSRGGQPRALALFGKDRLLTLLEELNTAISA